MLWVALKMLTGDRAKYLGSVAGVTFAALLIAQQASIFCGLMLRTTSQLQDIREASRTFQTFPVLYTRYHQALRFSAQERGFLPFILVKAQPGVPVHEVCARITARTRLKALTREDFGWATMDYYMKRTGIPMN